MSKKAMKLALEALEYIEHNYMSLPAPAEKAITALREALAEQPAQQEPVAYDKTEINCFAQDLYDQKMREGKRGHYESMFHVIHQCIKKVSPPAQRTWVSLTDVEWMNIVNKDQAWFGQRPDEVAHEVAKLVEAKLKEKNT